MATLTEIPIAPSTTGGSSRSWLVLALLLAFPSAGFIQLEMPTAWQDKPLLLKIWDMEGRIVVENSAFVSGSTVDVASLAKGLYQIEVMLNDEKLQCGFVRE